MPKHTLFTKHGSVAVFTLDRPPLNLINIGMIRAMKRTVKEVGKDEHLRVLIISGRNDVFSDGLDIDDVLSLDRKGCREFINMGQETIIELMRLEKPTIAAMAGRVMGMGLEIALACDFRLASEDSSFGLPEIKDGIIPAFGGAVLLERLIGRSRARALMFLGEPIPAWEALEIGLLGKVTPNDMVMEEARIVAGRIAVQPVAAIRALKMVMSAAEISGIDTFDTARDSLMELLRLSRKPKSKSHSPNRE